MMHTKTTEGVCRVAGRLLVTLGIVMVSGASYGGGLFNEIATPAVDDNPRSVVAANFDGADLIDLATADQDNDCVSVLLNTGTGSFHTSVAYGTGVQPEGLVAADLNGDTHPDLAVTNLWSNTVSVLLNNGDGTFATHVEYPVGGTPRGVVAADFNGDTLLDLATANASTENVSVLLNTGGGVFGTAVHYGVSGAASSLAAADLDGDLATDLAVTGEDTNVVSVLLNSSGTFPSFTTYDVGTAPQSVAAADLNDDTQPDLVIANFHDDQVSVLLNAGSGTFAAQVTYDVGSQPAWVTLANVNGDAFTDIITANSLGNDISVLLGNTNGVFASHSTYATGNDPRSVAAGDFNDDWDLDLAVANADHDTVSIMDNLTPLTPEIDVSPMSLDFGDVIVNDSTTQTFTISNLGNGDLTVTHIPSSNPDFSVTNPAFSQTISRGGSLEVTAEFSPTTTGALSGTLGVHSNDTDEPVVDVDVDGNGIIGPLDHFEVQLSPTQYNGDPFSPVAFENLIVAQDAFNNVVETFDASTNPVTVTVSPADGVVSGLGFSGTNVLDQAGDFGAWGSWGGGFADLDGVLVFTGLAGDHTFTATAATGETGTSLLDVTILPGDLDNFEFVLHSPQAHIVPFTGTNILTARDQSNNVITDFNASVNNVTITSDLAGTVSGLGSGSNNVLNQAGDFTNGVADLTGSLTFAGGFFDYHTFTATSGSASGTSGQVWMGLSGPNIFTLPPPPDFGDVVVGSYHDAPVTIESIGTQDLIVSQPTISLKPADYSVIDPVTFPVTLPPGSTLDITVRFNPTGYGLIAGMLDIPNNSIITPYQVPLTGVGLGGPVADAGGPYSGPEGSDIPLSAAGSTDSDGGTIVSYEWDFDNDGQYDDATGDPPTPMFNETEDGVYTVGLKVTDDDTLTDTDSVNVEVTNVAPVASFSSSITGPSVDFTDTSTDPGNDIITWAWDFGDGTTSSAQHPTHVFPGATTYTVTLTVTDNDSAWDDVSLNITPGGLFTATSPPGAGHGPAGVVIADLDGDPELDLATANFRGDDISVLLGTGCGGFATAVSYGAGDHPHAIAAGDLNGDGYTDLAVANAYSDNVSVLFNDGTGVFGADVLYGVGDFPRSIVVADFDLDHDLDLATANARSNNIAILTNNGDGTFGTKALAYYTTGTAPYGLVAADLNGDGYPDLATADYASDQVSVLLNNGGGTFPTRVMYGVGNAPYGLAAADLNGDGYVDLASANYLGDSVSVLLNNGTGSFATHVPYGVADAPYAVAAADFDSDGDVDLVTANFTPNQVSALLNNGNGTYGDHGTYGVGEHPRAIAAGNLDCTGGTDLVTANFDDNNVSVLLGTTSTVTPLPELDLVDPTSTVAEGQFHPVKVKVKLTARPATDVIATVTRAPWGDVDIITSPWWALTFTTANWNVAQSITVGAAQDDDVCDGATEITIAAMNTANSPLTMPVTEDDDDDLELVVLSDDPFEVPEDGSKTFTVQLSHQPCAAVTVAVAMAGNDTSLSALPASLTFTPSDWGSPQVVTVSAAIDADVCNGTDQVELTAAEAQNAPVVNVTEIEADTLALQVSSTDVDVTEGLDKTFTVSLTNEPCQDVTVTIDLGPGHDPDVSVAPPSLTFTTGDWSTAKSVTVTAGEDDDVCGGPAGQVNLTADGLDPVPVSVEEIENDVLELVVLGGPLNLNEDTEQTFTVELSHRPCGNVAVAIELDLLSLTGDPTLSVSPQSLTFTTGDWDTPKDVTVTAGPDMDVCDGTGEVDVTSADAQNAPVVNVTVTDDDELELEVSDTALDVTEPGSETFTVHLSNIPCADVTVALTPAGDPTLSVDPQSLTFTRTDWSVPQDVTVTAAADDDYCDGAGQVNVTSADAVNAPTVNVTVWDDDTLALEVSDTSLDVAEAGNESFTVHLSNKPCAEVTVSIDLTLGSDPDLSVAPASLTFDTGDWSTPKSVVVSAAADNDDACDGTGQIDVTTADAPTTVTVDVTEVDDEVLELDVVSANPLLVAEDGSATFTVQLSHAPCEDVTVSLDLQTKADPSFSVTPPTLVFPVADWGTPQTVTVEAGDDVDICNGTDQITVSAIEPQNAPVVILEEVDDDVLEFEIDAPDPFQVPEDGEETFTVWLSNMPCADVTVTLGLEPGSDPSLSVAPQSLTFAPGEWATAKSVTVSAAADGDVCNGTGQVNVTASGVPDESVAVTVLDDDDLELVATSADPFQVAEAGSASFTIHLSHEPCNDVTVTLGLEPGSDPSLSVVQQSLTFTTVNWAAPQDVTVNAAADDGDACNGTGQVNATAPEATNSIALAVTEIDDEQLAFDLSTASMPALAEGQSEMFTVALTHEPCGPVTVAIAMAPGSDLNIVPSPSTLIFNTTKWGQAKTVTVTAGDDVDVCNGTGQVQVSAAEVASLGTVDVTESDDDVLDMFVSPTALDVPEGGSASFTVKLTQQPCASVTATIVMVGGSDPSLTFGPSSLTFTTSNWATPQPVTVNAAQDPDACKDTGQLTVTAPGTASGTVTVNLTEADDETPEIVLSETSVIVPEAGTTSFTAKLSGEPCGDVTVTVAMGVGSDSDLSAAPSPLIFTTQNWGQEQVVTVGAIGDIDVCNGQGEVLLSSAQLVGDPAVVNATEADDDVLNLVLNKTILAVTEEACDSTVTVQLSGQPCQDASVQATMVLGSDPHLTVTPNSLTFTQANWNTPQTLEVCAAEDVDVANGTGTLRVTCPDCVNAPEVAITENDIDTLSLEATPPVLIVAEGGSEGFAVKLSNQPSGAVAVTVARQSGDADLSASPAALQFTASTWNTSQTVTVAAAADNDLIDDTTIFSVSSASTASVTVTAIEDDRGRPPVADADGPYTMDEGDTIVLSGAGSTDPDGDLATYEWDLDDDGFFDDAADALVQITLTEHGEHPIALRVTDSVGFADIDDTTITVSNVAPTADFTWVSRGLSFTFTDASTDPGQDIVSWLWDFGDGNTSAAQNPSHTYEAAAAYTVALTVTDDGGDDGRKSVVIVAEGIFQDPEEYGAGAGPSGVAAAELDSVKSSGLDLAVANSEANTVSVLRNQGNGTFASHVTYAVGQQPIALVAADVDGDSRMDLVTADRADHQVSVLINGAKGFAARVVYSVGTYPQGIEAADLTGDGRPELVTANYLTSNISVLVNNGDGTFATQVTYSVGLGPYDVAAADLDGDNDVDLAVANYWSHSVSVLLNNGTGVFGPPASHATDNAPSCVIAADVDDDGDQDLVTANYSGDSVSVLLNDGVAGFAAAASYPVGSHPLSVVALDADSDGAVDLATADDGSDTVSLLLNAGDGAFLMAVEYSVGGGPRSIVAAALDDDPHPDLATANFESNDVSVLLNGLGAGAPARLSGTVRDKQTNALLKGARVIAENQSTGAKLKDKTGKNGQYELLLAPGDYLIKIKKKGYRTKRNTMTLGEGDDVTKNYKLRAR